MARKSRKPNRQLKIEPEPTHRYIAGAYVRVSDDSVDSIESQEAIIMDFLSDKKDILLHKLYVDDGVSSFLVVRPGYEALIHDAENNIITCIIVKDLSRLGRSYLDTGELVWHTLPAWNVRLISINDRYDSIEENRTSRFKMSVINVMNSSYSQDISKKIKSTIRLEQQNGTYLAALVPFGYIKEVYGDETRYAIDGEAARVVTTIFSLASAGESAFSIANHLNESIAVASRLWTRRNVMDILRNQFYTGALVTGKRKTLSNDLRHLKRVHPNEWFVFENHHPPIISKELFGEVQTILDARRFAHPVSEIHPQHDVDAYLGKLLFCGYCGRKMKRRVWKGKTYFICPQYMEAKGSCDINSMSAETLKHELFDAIQSRIEESQAYHDRQYRFEKSNLYSKYREFIVSRLNGLQNQYASASQARLAFYQNVCDSVYTPSDYRAYTKSLDQHLDKLLLEIHSIKREMDEYDNFKSANCVWVREFLKFKLSQELTEQMYRCLFEKVSVHSGRVELLWKMNIF